MLSFVRRYRFEILLFLFYTLLAVVITWPLILNFSSSVHGIAEEYVLEADVAYSTPVRTADSFGGIWELWWKKQAFLRGEDWQFCPLLGPNGVTVDFGVFHMPIVNFVAKWLAILTNEVFAFNLLILMSFPLAGMAMYLLAYHVTKNRWAAALAGFIYAFSPLHRRYSFEWLGMAQWHWLPVYVLALLKLDSNETNRTDGTNGISIWLRYRWALLTGLLFSITFIENYYFGFFAIFFTVAFVIFRLIRHSIRWRYLGGPTRPRLGCRDEVGRARSYSGVMAYLPERQGSCSYIWHSLVRYLAPYLIAFLVVAVLTLPVTLTFVKGSAQLAAGEETELSGFVRDEWQRFAFSARPWYYFLPDVNHPVFGELTEKFYSWISQKPPFFLTKPFYPREHTLYLGITTLLLAGVAVLVSLRSLISKIKSPASSAGRRGGDETQKSFLRNIVVSLYRYLGDSTVNVRYVTLFLLLGLAMMVFSAPPYATINLHKIYFPAQVLYRFFPMFRSYARFGVLVLLCVSILAGIGLSRILRRVGGTNAKIVICSLLFALCFFEFLDFPPMHNISLETLPVYHWIVEQPGDFAVLVYPEDDSNFDLNAQRLHQKRYINPKGWTPQEVRDFYPQLGTLDSLEALRGWGVKYVILEHPSSLGWEQSYKLIETYENPTRYLFEVSRGN